MEIIIKAIILSILPIAELRGGIPYGFYNGINIFTIFFICVIANILIIPFVFLFLETLNKLFLHIKVYKKVFNKIIEHSRKKIHKKIEKYGYLGLMIFVAIPLPITGAYTGTLGAWALGMDKKKAFLYIVLGVVISGIIVSLVSYFGIEGLKLFIKQLN